MLRQIITLFCFFVCFYTNLQAQDPIFSQFYAAPLQVNPAFAGNSTAPAISLNYRNQWTALKAYSTYAASYDQFFKSTNSGLGVVVLTDDAGQGIYKTNKLSGVYAYKLAITNDLYVKLGIEAGVLQNRLDWDKLVFYDQLDDLEGAINDSEEIQPEDLTKTYVDISSGLLLYSRKFYGGISLKHINTPNQSLLDINNNLNIGLPMRLTLHGGAEFKLSDGNKKRQASFISPNAMLIRQGGFGQVNFGVYGNLGLIFAGGWFRHTFSSGEAVIFLLGVQKGIFKIGYSFDMTVSGLVGQVGGTHEISLKINFEEDKSTDFNDCFKMFR